MIKLICYGAGNVFRNTTHKLNHDRVTVIAVADKDVDKAHFAASEMTANECGVVAGISPKEIFCMEYDYVLICNVDSAFEMTMFLEDNGVPRERICYADKVPIGISSGKNITNAMAYYLLEAAKNNYILSDMLLPDRHFHYFFCKDAARVNKPRHLKDFYSKAADDFVRVSTLELLADQVIEKSIPGSLAEAGVASGHFAVLINEMFPTRKLYLFDTFEGHDDRDIKHSVQSGVINNDTERFFEKDKVSYSMNTPEAILERMPFRDMCVIKKGYFPESALDLDDGETFSLVSLDMNLYSPTYEGLKFFYPRMSRGGYILIHDYNCYVNNHCGGIKIAVDRYCTENSITPVPVSDLYGSAIIVKQ
ncbi:MAG: TylF/MycF family methyltransferase [Oscillospiraceae bacterium]|nr:TylF/MycF family methyltransferase [Oscillospiraceae bacterium]